MDLENRTLKLPWVVVVLLIGLCGGGGAATAFTAGSPRNAMDHAEVVTRAEMATLQEQVNRHEVQLGKVGERLTSIDKTLAGIDSKLDRVLFPSVPR